MAEPHSRYSLNSTTDDRSSIAASESSHRKRKTYSLASNDTGESSKRHHAPDYTFDESLDNSSPLRPASSLHPPADNSRKRRSHKSSSSGSFLLGNSLLDSTSVFKRDTQLPKRKEAVRDIKGKHVIRREQSGQSGPNFVTEDVQTSALDNRGDDLSTSTDVDYATSIKPPDSDMNKYTNGVDSLSHNRERSPSQVSDLDSKLIVNLALGLSEGRRNAQRRIGSTSSAHMTSTSSDTKPEGSLSQHMKQRRVSRNMSPRSERVSSAYIASPDAYRRTSTLLQPQAQGESQYDFSASTLARAEKARVHIELMAQYRRVLQYVPPLRPISSQETSAATRPRSGSSSKRHNLGREYNPLQYLRNRNLRARERKTIDGQSDGFGDVDRVKMWIDEIAKCVAGDPAFLTSDPVPLPPLRHIEESGLPASEPSVRFGASSKRAQPRIGWTTVPADMLAEIYWLEQDDNKRLIEDNQSRKIYPQEHMGGRNRSNTIERPNHARSSNGASIGSANLDFEVGDKLPAFKSIKDTEPQASESGLARIRHKLHLSDSRAHIDHKTKSKDIDSDSGSEKRVHRERRGTVAQADVLEKQMRAILAKEAQEGAALKSPSRDNENLAKQSDVLDHVNGDKSINGQTGSHAPIIDSTQSKQKSAASVSDNSRQNSARSSLELPVSHTRASLELPPPPLSSLHSNLKNSASFTASNSRKRTPDHSRESSPERSERTPLARLRSKLPFTREGSPERPGTSRVTRQGLVRTYTAPTSPTSPTSPSSPLRNRNSSRSPTRRLLLRNTGDSFRSIKSTLPQRRDLEPSGIRGLFKSGRNNVSRIGDAIWKKDSANTSVTESSEDEDETVDATKASGKSRNLDNNSTEGRHSLDLPSFTSAFDHRSQDRRVKSDELHSPSKYPDAQNKLLSDDSRSAIRKLPRIDVSQTSPSPQRESHYDNNEQSGHKLSRGRSNLNVRNTSTRLNDMLGLPGKLSESKGYRGLPVTGLMVPSQDRPRSLSRHWSGASERSMSADPTQRGGDQADFTRIRTLLLSSGVKACEIVRRSGEVRDIREPDMDPIMRNFKKEVDYPSIVKMNRDETIVIKQMPRSQEHVTIAKILSSDIQLSSLHWQQSATKFTNTTVPALLSTISSLQIKIIGHSQPLSPSSPTKSTKLPPISPPNPRSAEQDGLSGRNKEAADEADVLSRELVEVHTLKVKVLNEKIDRLLRRRRQRFRWLRRSGWVLLEWFLVAIMWFVWAIVTAWKTGSAVILGIIKLVRWLLWFD